LLSLIICPFVTSFSEFLFARNLDYWFLGTSYFVYIDISDSEYGGSLFSDWSFIVVGECFFRINVHRSCFVSWWWLLVVCDAQSL